MGLIIEWRLGAEVEMDRGSGDYDEVIILISAQVHNYLLPSCMLVFILEKKIVEGQYGSLNALKSGI